MIHPTAVIHPEAQLGERVTIGPYAIVEGPSQIGDDCTLESHAVLKGRVTLGAETIISTGAVIGGPPQDLGWKDDVSSEVRLGARNRIREHCTIHRGAKEGGVTTTGDDCFMMAGSHLGHDVQVGKHVIIANNALLGGHVQVGDFVFIGGGSVFHQHMRVGAYVITQGKSGFSKDIPPYTIGAETNMIAGLNVIGMRRAGFNPEQRAAIKRAFSLVYREGLNVGQAMKVAAEQPWAPEAQAFFDFIKGREKRGICALLGDIVGATPEQG